MSTSTSQRPGVRPARRRRWPVVLAVVVPVLAVVVAIVVWVGTGPLSTVTAPPPDQPLFTVPELDVAAGSAVPTAPPAVPTVSAARARWLTRVSGRTDIPRRVLTAYVTAAAVTTTRHPACHLSWATLAGIGRTESDHGQHHGDVVDPDGTEQWPVVGPALDGSPGVQRIPDTDHGRLDGDLVWDHAVGPMQFLPSRWTAMGERASGDGHPADPQNIDDAALTAATYLCESGDLAVPARWWAAAFHYDNSLAYGRAVFSAAVAYAEASAVGK